MLCNSSECQYRFLCKWHQINNKEQNLIEPEEPLNWFNYTTGKYIEGELVLRYYCGEENNYALYVKKETSEVVQEEQYD